VGTIAGLFATRSIRWPGEIFTRFVDRFIGARIGSSIWVRTVGFGTSAPHGQTSIRPTISGDLPTGARPFALLIYWRCAGCSTG
jgi:hypothetical protein